MTISILYKIVFVLILKIVEYEAFNFDMFLVPLLKLHPS